MDVILDQVKRLGKGCLLYKVDISIAFRHIKLDPHDYDLLGLRDVCHYVDTCLPFGFRHRSALFQRLSDAVRHIMCQDGYDVINYIDDIIGVDVPSKIYNSFTLLQETLIYLGFELSNKNIVPPTTNLNCLGIMVDTTTFTASIPSDKYCNKRDLQSLLGSLLYVSKCVKTSRFS